MSKIEIIVLNQEDAKTAEANGGDRLELVSAIAEGGLTPSYGTIKTVVKSVEIPVMVMVRPHSYSFEYHKNEWEAIKEDIKIIKELGAAGIVFGGLTEKHTVDFEILDMVLEEAQGLSITFHRAIDQTDALAAYKSLCNSPYYVERILTSGGKPTVLEGLDPLNKMLAESKKILDQPIIMPGSGLSSNNIEYIHKQLQASEYHFGSAVRINRDFRNQIDGDEIQKIKRMVN
ncbi:copper homeostasis protein CutC [Neobacillus vireti]|uniref:PF03932 family protein CutC n=1 Tax=Neobacillus vireti LMG 21834 TaxID=1131730 RepID=A0AB94IUT8_9BACI|nr:copper homeostasis protein CutC [Neobacillus vireti]ETI70835.1 copper homeostasis protein [Neobacillus vireti LMG 21834]KLT17628.1 copper homeostasis protein CutC [Neobacillus vireti]